MDGAKALGVACLADADEATWEAGLASMTDVVAKRSRHVITEIGRVRKTVQALEASGLEGVGKLLTASPRSSQHDFENSTPELDFLVDTLESAPGGFGARLPGGGFGGAVMALTSAAFDQEAAEKISAAYDAKHSARPEVLNLLSADGAEVVSISSE